uniref:Phytochromobilin:ferredoxin oxidoreductase n=2 Tax=Kalanchoe fedtschenkoi TaxID=63787 RepID=A0A7N0TI38_KALFE
MASLLSFLSIPRPLPLATTTSSAVVVRGSIEVKPLSYHKFLDSALDETRRRVQLRPSPLQESFSSLKGMDAKTDLHMLSFEAPKIRLLRGLHIDGGESLQVLDFAAFPRPEFDLPIFCANFFTASSTNIIVLDLNPLYDVITRVDYREKYYKALLPLAQKYTTLLPWGGKLTSESLRLFSPIVIWTRFASTPYMHDVLYSAFMDYYKAWLEIMDQATEEVDEVRISENQEAQHRYLTWRAEKDPGSQLLKKLIGNPSAKDLIKNFLFNGRQELGSKTFLDYFPEYQCEDGTINEKRSIMGKSFEDRPWDARGEFIGSL